MREIAQARVRYGYRKIRVLLNREGWQVGKYLVCQLYKEEGLALKKRPQRRRKAERNREERFVATAPNQAWSLDFVANQIAGRETVPCADHHRCVYSRERSHRSGPKPEGRRCGKDVEPVEAGTRNTEVSVL
jgi:transposase InsO family protein